LLQHAQKGSSAASHAVSLLPTAQIPPALAATRELALHRTDLVHVSPPPVAPYLPLHRNPLVHVSPTPFAPYPPLAGAYFYKDEDAMVLDENSHLK
jgi:hypothetical protein